MNERVLKVSFFILLITTVTLAVFSMKSYRDSQISRVWAKGVTNDYSAKNSELDRKNKEIDNNIKELQDKYYEEKLTKLLDKQQLTTLAKEEWKYSLKVNNTEFSGFYIYPKSQDVTILLVESQQESTRLPQKIHDSGRLTGGDSSDRFYDHLLVESTVPYKIDIEEKGSIIKAYYRFKKVPSGTIINLKLSEPLRERLKLDYADLEVIMK